MTKPDISLFAKLPVPEDFFRGSNFPRKRIPQEILAFFRGSKSAATDYGDFSQHHRFVLCFCLRTAGSMHIGADLFELHPYEGGLIFPYQPHHFTLFAADEIAWLFISFEMEDADWLEPLRGTVYSIDEETIGLLNKIAAHRLGRAEDAVDVMAPLLVLLLERLLHSDSIMRKTTAAKAKRPKTHLHNNLSTTLEFIHQNLHLSLSVSEVVTESHCSETVLRELFEKYLNTSIATYIRKMRVLRACHLLDATHDDIGAISDQCGFSSHYAFSRTFKQVAGFSPNAYRRKHRKPKC